MRYIRTKDEIIDVSYMQEYEADDENGNRVFDGYGYDNSPIYYPIENIIKQADTIEELCDRFVAIHKTLKDTDCITRSLQGMLKEGFSIDTWNIYGAIWTDKGLIYVAKMNDKGELELL